jgi:hypothetical protein
MPNVPPGGGQGRSQLVGAHSAPGRREAPFWLQLRGTPGVRCRQSGIDPIWWTCLPMPPAAETGRTVNR